MDERDRVTFVIIRVLMDANDNYVFMCVTNAVDSLPDSFDML